MTPAKRFLLNNAMLLGNLLANVVGVQIVRVISAQYLFSLPEPIAALAFRVDRFFLPISFLTVGSAIVLYELPIRRFLNRAHRGLPGGGPELLARQRLLNEPFVLGGLDMTIWLVAAVLYPAVFHAHGAGAALHLPRVFFQTLLVGMVTSIIAFFVSERTLQRRMAPLFFPDGGLFQTPGTVRIRIRVRIAAMVLACNIVPCIAFVGSMRGIEAARYSPEITLGLLNAAIGTNTLIFIGVGLLLTVLVSSNLSRPFREIIHVLRGVRRGRLDRRVRVTSNDEIGYTGDVINDMTDGLRERERMRHSLNLAGEVQQSLFPKFAPTSAGLQVAGKSIYCDQTGGDWFDYLDLGPTGGGRIGLVVGDVSDHGIPSALLMATARAFLRLRATMAGGPGEVISDVNRQLTRDAEETGQFMTMLYLVADMQRRTLTWVRAGHDPALLYDPANDAFTELGGPGIACGLDPFWHYHQSEMTGLRAGQVILLLTDGIWEARDASGEMFGKKRVRRVIREHRRGGAGAILEALLAELSAFQGSAARADDVTLVVAKVVA